MIKHFFLTGTLLLCCALCVLTTSCSTSGGENANCTVISVTEGLKTKGKLNLSEIVSDFDVIRLSGEKESYFINSRWVSVGKKFIVIGCDVTNKVMVFDSVGQFIRLISGVGKGPGEYQRMRGVSLSPNEKNVILIDPFGKKVLLYTIEGTFIKEKSLEEVSPSIFPSNVAFLNDSLFTIRFRRPGISVEDFSRFAILNTNLEIIRFESKVKSAEDAKLPGITYGSFGKSDKGFMFWEEFTDTLFEFDENLERIVGRYKFDFKGTGVTSEIAEDQNPVTRNRNRNQINYFWTVIDLKYHILAPGYASGEPILLVWDKIKQMPFSISYENNCVISNFELRPSINNDLYGIEPFYIWAYQPSDGLLISTIDPDEIASKVDLNCLKLKNVINPDKRDSLLAMIQKSDGQNHYVIKLRLR